MIDTHPEAQLFEVEHAGHAPALMSAPEIERVRNFLAPAGAERDAPRRRPAPPARRGARAA
jgi:hypothetical protein